MPAGNSALEPGGASFGPKDRSFNLPHLHLPIALNAGLLVRIQISLKPGRYRIRLGISDTNSYRICILECL
jgi:hypothetical protein